MRRDKFVIHEKSRNTYNNTYNLHERGPGPDGCPTHTGAHPHTEEGENERERGLERAIERERQERDGREREEEREERTARST